MMEATLASAGDGLLMDSRKKHAKKRTQFILKVHMRVPNSHARPGCGQTHVCARRRGHARTRTPAQARAHTQTRIHTHRIKPKGLVK